MKIPRELQVEREKIEAYALEYGLDFFPVHFEMVDHDQLNEVAAYGGFPTRYPHWRWGMAYEELSKGYQYGLSKIYELVINNDPTYAYLMTSNTYIAQKLVIAHVFGHGDFFKNNYAFSKTRRNMIDTMANHATRIWRYVDRYGQDVVERFIDACLSVENLIDPFLPFVPVKLPAPIAEVEAPDDDTKKISANRFEAKDYMDRYINPPEVLESQRLKAVEEAKQAPKFPLKPERDVLLFVLNFAPLKKWQRDVLSIIREEAYYFMPQGLTKIMNEGWASYWHSKIMTEKACNDAEILDFAELHAGTMATSPGQLNPYKLGLDLYRDIERRWNKGQHGLEWEDCDDVRARAEWDTGAMAGRDKIFEVRKHYDDVSFVDEFLTQEFCEQHGLFTWEPSEYGHDRRIVSREFSKVKQKLLGQLSNMGQPIILVSDGNYLNRGELLLEHQHAGADLDRRYIDQTMQNIRRLWGRPVNLVTQMEDNEVVFVCDKEGVRMMDEVKI